MKLALMTILGTFLISTAFGNQNQPYYDSLYTEGNTAYQSKNYEAALQSYRQITDAGLSSAEVYYNMGNTYFKLQQYAEAIYAFEKALQKNPGNADYIYNLELAQKGIVDKIAPLPIPFYKKWWNNIVNTFSVDQWAITGLIIFFFAGLFFVFFLLGSTVFVKRFSFFLFIAFFISSGLFFLFAQSQFQRNYSNQYGIVFSNRVSVFSEPNMTSTELFVIHKGIKVEIAAFNDTWIKVVLPDGSIGWIPEEAIRNI